MNIKALHCGDYSQARRYLESLPMFQKQGKLAYNPGLETSNIIDDAMGNPHRDYSVIHVGGTNGKGSTAHMLAAVLACAGYKVGLYTSPHLVDFRERIRINGEKVPEKDLVDSLNRFFDVAPVDCQPTFFELTTILAFECFRKAGVDIAVVEVGLGGRLDTTNVVAPVVSVITNVSLDHTAILGPTCEDIAREKAGIIKPGIPAVIGEAESGVLSVFREYAEGIGAPLCFAQESADLTDYSRSDCGGWNCVSRKFGAFHCDLSGDCQPLNIRTVLAVINVLVQKGWSINASALAGGMDNVCGLTGLFGRWSVINDNPLVVVDTGHNPGGWRFLSRQIARFSGKKHIVLGFAQDKDVAQIMDMIAEAVRDADYYFTRPSVERGMSEHRLAVLAAASGLNGVECSSVEEAYKEALSHAGKGEMVFVGGSGFVVADLLRSI